MRASDATPSTAHSVVAATPGPDAVSGAAAAVGSSAPRLPAAAAPVPPPPPSLFRVPYFFAPGRTPFAPQLPVMSNAIAACVSASHALIESPTGTGKTLALLCATLSYQRHLLTRAAEPPVDGSADAADARQVRIIYSSRTHSQLSQVARELARLTAFCDADGAVAAAVRLRGSSGGVAGGAELPTPSSQSVASCSGKAAGAPPRSSSLPLRPTTPTVTPSPLSVPAGASSLPVTVPASAHTLAAADTHRLLAMLANRMPAVPMPAALPDASPTHPLVEPPLSPPPPLSPIGEASQTQLLAPPATYMPTQLLAPPPPVLADVTGAGDDSSDAGTAGATASVEPGKPRKKRRHSGTPAAPATAAAAAGSAAASTVSIAVASRRPVKRDPLSRAPSGPGGQRAKGGGALAGFSSTHGGGGIDSYSEPDHEAMEAAGVRAMMMGGDVMERGAMDAGADGPDGSGNLIVSARARQALYRQTVLALERFRAATSDGAPFAPKIVPPLLMTILASRSQTCVNDEVRELVGAMHDLSMHNGRAEHTGGASQLLIEYDGERSRAPPLHKRRRSSGGKGRAGAAAGAATSAAAARAPMTLDEACDDMIRSPTEACRHFGAYSHLLQQLAPTFTLEDLVASARGDVAGEKRSASGAPRRRADQVLMSGGCPHFFTRELHRDADLTFCPYNYVLDASIRRAMGLNLAGAVVVIDEAHNLEDVCREAASFNATREMLLAVLVNTATVTMHKSSVAVAALHKLAAQLLAWLDAACSVLKLGGGPGVADAEGDGAGGGRVWSAAGGGGAVGAAADSEAAEAPVPVPTFSKHGSDLVAVSGGSKAAAAAPARGPVASHRGGFAGPRAGAGFFAAEARETGDFVWSGVEAASIWQWVGVSLATIASLQGALDQAVTERKEVLANPLELGDDPQRYCLTSGSVAFFDRLLGSLSYALGVKPPMWPGAPATTYMTDYRLVVSCEAAGLQRRRRLIWMCLSPAVAFREVASLARSVIITSGTLRPLAAFAKELGVPFKQRVSTAHVINVRERVWAGVVGAAPAVSGIRLVRTSVSSGGGGSGDRTLASGPRGWSVELVSAGVEAGSLDGSYKMMSENQTGYFSRVAAALLALAVSSGGGILAFFPSYTLLNGLVTFMKAREVDVSLDGVPSRMSLWSAFHLVKLVVIESNEGGPAAFRAALDAYWRCNDEAWGHGAAAGAAPPPAVAMDLDDGAEAAAGTCKEEGRAHGAAGGDGAPLLLPPPSAVHGERTGAMLLGVCRGKAAEGIDFRDWQSRVVVMVSVPFPSVADLGVQLKREHQRTLCGQYRASGNTGDDCAPLDDEEWYMLQAFRAVNQAVGRAIRHRDDYGAIVLLDARYGQPKNVARLAGWLADSVNVSPSLGTACAAVSALMARMEHAPASTTHAVASSAPAAPAVAAPFASQLAVGVPIAPGATPACAVDLPAAMLRGGGGDGSGGGAPMQVDA